jgi:phytoene synthase
MAARIDPSLRDSYESCRKLHRRRDPTYYWATRRLPPDVRPAVHALYAFVREVDDVVDAPGGAPAAERRTEVALWEERLRRAMAGRPPGHPVVAALADAGRRHDLPLHELDLYFDSMRIDCAPVRVQTWPELERYMLGSAGSVGHILGALLGAPEAGREPFERLALGFQLTNFVRDVREDWELDRVYMPAEDLERFGVSTRDIARGEPTPGFRRLLALEVERARALFREGAAAMEVVSPSVRRGMRMARCVYEGVLDRTERLGFDVLRHRAALPPWELAGVVATGLRASASGEAAGSAGCARSA